MSYIVYYSSVVIWITKCNWRVKNVELFQPTTSFFKPQISRSCQPCSQGERVSVLCVVCCHAIFLLVTLPMNNAPEALWKSLCVHPRTSDLLLSAKLWKMSLQLFFSSHNHGHIYWRHAFLTHTMLMLLLHSGTQGLIEF